MVKRTSSLSRGLLFFPSLIRNHSPLGTLLPGYPMLSWMAPTGIRHTQAAHKYTTYVGKLSDNENKNKYFLSNSNTHINEYKILWTSNGCSNILKECFLKNLRAFLFNHTCQNTLFLKWLFLVLLYLMKQFPISAAIMYASVELFLPMSCLHSSWLSTLEVLNFIS